MATAVQKCRHGHRRLHDRSVYDDDSAKTDVPPASLYAAHDRPIAAASYNFV